MHVNVQKELTPYPSFDVPTLMNTVRTLGGYKAVLFKLLWRGGDKA